MVLQDELQSFKVDPCLRDCYYRLPYPGSSSDYEIKESNAMSTDLTRKKACFLLAKVAFLSDPSQQ